MANTVPKIKLNDGSELPYIGLGTSQAKEKEVENAVKDAIDIGYRHIDTAHIYTNEKEVGAAIRAKIAEGIVKREDMYIVTKLWNTFHEPELVEKACRLSYDKLNIGPIDLYLMHSPMGYEFHGWMDDDLLPTNDAGNLLLNDVDYVETWKAMEDCVKLGLVKSIGVSNFNSEQIDRILSIAKIKPVVNQVECNPSINQHKLIKFCSDRNILITSFCPLGRPDNTVNIPSYPTPAIHDDRIKTIAEKYYKTPAQIVLRYLIEIGTIPLPKSTNRKRLEENFNIFDFKLENDDILMINSFNTGVRRLPGLQCSTHKYYPLNIEF